MKLILITVVALVVVATLACGNEADDPFLKEMADWFYDNPGFYRQENALRTLDDISRKPWPRTKYYNEYRILRDTLELLPYTLEHTEIFPAEEYQRAESLGYDLDEMIACGYFTESFDVSLQFYRTCNIHKRLRDLFRKMERHWVEDDSQSVLA